MRLPFVSRWTLERIDAELRLTRAENAALQSRYDALLAKYHGLVERPTGPAPASLPERKSDPVSEAIGLAAGTNGVLRRQLGAYAKQQRLAGQPEEEIVASLLHWQDDDSGVPV